MNDNLIKMLKNCIPKNRHKEKKKTQNLLPDQPDVHSQLKFPSPSKHFPPFLQGFGKHSSRSLFIYFFFFKKESSY